VQTLKVKREKPLLSFFLGKTVTVEVERGLEVRGQLLRYEYHNHKPNLLIVENSSGKHIIRGRWTIKSERVVGVITSKRG